MRHTQESPLLSTKLFIPYPGKDLVSRLRLIERINDGLGKKLTLVSAPAGFGKSTLLVNWISQSKENIAWISLDKEDNDTTRFIAYLITALNQVKNISKENGKGALSLLAMPQTPPACDFITSLINDISQYSGRVVLILDDFHMVNSTAIVKILTFLIEHQPTNLHLMISTREDPSLPLSRLRASGQMTELRAADLRFTAPEATIFLNQLKGLDLSKENISALETRTEGWIAGLQLAAISMQGHKNAQDFINSFTGSHHFVLDYLVEEVLQQQSESIQTFLLRTSILNRLCGPLCDTLIRDKTISGQKTLEYLEQANLFLIPLDNKRHWYRYHNLFAEFLRQRLQQSTGLYAKGNKEIDLAELHIHASEWFENNGLEFEAFQHAAAANDIDRAERLIVEDKISQHFRGSVTVILNWLRSLSKNVLDARPWLWWKYASLLLINGQTTGVEEKLQAAETALSDVEQNDKSKNLIGQIAAARATLAFTRYDIEAMLVQSRTALKYLRPDNPIPRSSAYWTLGYAYFLRRDISSAKQAFTDAISTSQAAGDTFTTILASIGLGNIHEAQNQLNLAAEIYQRVLELAGNQPIQIISEAHLGLARVFYEWNDLDSAEKHAQESFKLASQYERIIDRFVSCEVFLARLKLARGDISCADQMLHKSMKLTHQYNFTHQIPEVAVAQVLVLLHKGDLENAAKLAEKHNLPISQSRVLLAQGKPSEAWTMLAQWRQQAEERDWKDEQLKSMVLQSIALYKQNNIKQAVQMLEEILAMAEPNGFIRVFVDEGPPMAHLLDKALSHQVNNDYINRIQAAFPGTISDKMKPPQPKASESDWVEPLSEREIEVLQLIAEGLTNQEIADRLFLSLHTVKVHARNIYSKLGVKNRTQAVSKGKVLKILDQS